jgi:hypothetical protein
MIVETQKTDLSVSLRCAHSPGKDVAWVTCWEATLCLWGSSTLPGGPQEWPQEQDVWILEGVPFHCYDLDLKNLCLESLVSR